MNIVVTIYRCPACARHYVARDVSVGPVQVWATWPAQALAQAQAGGYTAQPMLISAASPMCLRPMCVADEFGGYLTVQSECATLTAGGAWLRLSLPDARAVLS